MSKRRKQRRIREGGGEGRSCSLAFSPRAKGVFFLGSAKVKRDARKGTAKKMSRQFSTTFQEVATITDNFEFFPQLSVSLFMLVLKRSS